jgi:hypothetical protein
MAFSRARRRFERVSSALVVLTASSLGGFAACSGDSGGSAIHAGGGSAGNAGSAGSEAGICIPGSFRCEDNVARRCEAGGPSAEGTDCAASGAICTEQLGCVTCIPGAGSCKDGVGSWCRSDGSKAEFECDATQGMTCEADGCKGACSAPELADSYLGCDYYPTVTLNPVWSGFPFAVAVANAGRAKTRVTVTRGASQVESVEIEAGKLQVIKLPWVAELKGGDENACRVPPAPGATRIVKGGAYRLRTDQPVTVYQLSPLTYHVDPAPPDCPVGTKCPGGVIAQCFSYTNDASLLLPATALSGNYTALGWPAARDRAGFVAVTATRDGTEVEVAGSGEFAAGAGIDATGRGTVTLDRGDVLELISRSDGPGDQYGADLSGSRIRASAPVQVIAGHSCGNVPTPTTAACDHLEDAVLPSETLGKEYYVTFPAAVASQSPHVVRISAVQPNTALTFDPPSVSGPVTLEPGGAPFELRGVSADFKVSATAPILVAQYMQGQDSVESHSGDPSLAFAVPAAQYRNQYLFVASKTYDSNFVNVVAPTGTAVTLDGNALAATAFTPIGGSGFAVARVELSSAEVHTIDSAQPFGIVVYGYGLYTSYMYPGGLDLKRISPPPIF